MNDAKQSPVKPITIPEIAPTHTKMSPLELSVEWWSHWADMLGLAAIIIGVILAVVGGFGWGFSWKAGKLKDQLLNEQIINAPLKARVTTATASVRIEVNADVAKSFSGKKASDGSIGDLNFGKSANFRFENDLLVTGAWTLFLKSEKVEQFGNESGSEFFLEFHPVSFSPINVAENVEELLNALDLISLQLWSLPRSSQILNGTVTLTLNGTTKRTFSIPETRTGNVDGGVLLLFKSDRTAILAPKVVILK